MKSTQVTLVVSLLSLSLVACAADEVSDGTGGDSGSATGSGGTHSANSQNTFDHENSGADPWEIIERLKKEGPPRFTARMHGCPKVRISTLRNTLASRGVNVGNGASLSAGQLLSAGQNAMGGPNFANRVPETMAVTTSASSRQFDIYAAASNEIIANIGNQAACQLNGQPAQLFDANNKCVASGVTCLTGIPASPEALALCDRTVTQASTPDLGRRMAVAVVLAAAHTCE